MPNVRVRVYVPSLQDVSQGSVTCSDEESEDHYSCTDSCADIEAEYTETSDMHGPGKQSCALPSHASQAPCGPAST